MSVPYENIERELTDAHGRPMVLFCTGRSTFSNFYLCAFKLDGREYWTSEQYYQREKAVYFGDYEKAEEIAVENKPSKCKRLAHDIKNFRIEAWQRVASDVMVKAVLAKFRQNPTAREKLLKTGSALLVEATLFDRYWASGLEIGDDHHRHREAWRGANVLGEVLMRVRDIICREQ